MKEFWADVEGFPNHEVSSLGRVRNWRSGIILRPRPSGWGYLQVMLYKNQRVCTKTVHKMVAEAFLDNPLSLPEVNHKDGNKHNNSAANLEWVTKGENNLHAVSTGLRKPRGTKVEIVQTGEVFPTVKACAEHLGGYPTTISAILNGRLNSWRGYTFRYVR